MREILLKRIVEYTGISTQSNRSGAEEKKPSTDCQWDLLRKLEVEMKGLGLVRVELTEQGFLFGRIPASSGAESAPSIGLMAHVDTASDAPGMGVVPRIHENYGGGNIVLDGGTVLSPDDFPSLKKHIGDTIITSSGETLLGADDKAGVAAIMTLAEYLITNPHIKHGPLEILFTPDEETGTGMDGFPLDKLESKFCYTVDGGEEGEVEEECYYAYGAHVDFTGVAIHPGKARGKMVNAASMAAYYAMLLPRSESPEATDERYGNYWVNSMRGQVETAELVIMVRDFDQSGMDRRLKALEAFVLATEAAFPGGKCQLKIQKQYVNMREGISREPRLMENLMAALEEAGVKALHKPIRGGTDGSRLTEMGIPTPNIFTGGHNYHSRSEWIPLGAMEKCFKVLVKLVEKWAE